MVTELIKRLRTGDRLAPLPVRLGSPRGPSPPLELNGYSLPDLDGSYFFGLRLVGSAGAENGEGGPTRDVESGLLDAAAFAQMESRRAREAQARGEEVSLMTVRLDETAGLRQATNDHLVRTIGAYLRAGSVGGDSAGRLDESSYGFLHRPDLDVSAITARIEAHVRAHGASLTTGRVERAATLLADSDDSMAVLYAIKAMCDNALQGAAPAAALDSLVRDAASQARAFRDILATGQFEFAFQPIVNLETRVVHHHEVLVRFPSELGASPQQMIVFAESTGLISEFDLTITRRLLEWLDAERAVGKRHKVAVNLSARSFASAKFGEALHKLLDRFPAVRAQLMFELTESARIDDLDAVNEFIKGLRAKGHKVCLDDFGAGAWSGARGVCRDVTAERTRAAQLAAAESRERLVNHIVRRFRDETEPAAILEAAASVSAQALGAAAGRVYVSGRSLMVAASYGAPATERERAMLAECASATEPVLAEIVGDHLLIVATIWRRGVNGALALLRGAERGPWTDEDCRLALDVAAQLGVVIEQINNRAMLERMSRTDEITDLLNRRAFFDGLSDRLARQVAGGAAGALLFVDLDNFKLVNDSHGHAAGDEALRRVARLLAERVRPGDLVARLGGDEFAAWIDRADEAAARRKGESLVESVRALGVPTGDAARPLGASVGIAVSAPGSGEALDQLINRADAAMYAVKHGGKGHVALAPPELAPGSSNEAGHEKRPQPLRKLRA